MWRNQGKGVASPLKIRVVAFEKGAFGSTLTSVANFTYLLYDTSWDWTQSPGLEANTLTIMPMVCMLVCVCLCGLFLGLHTLP